MEVAEFYQTLDSLYQDQKISEVEAFLAKVADQSISCCGRVMDLGIACLNEQGTLYRSQGDYGQSILCLETALEYLALQKGSDSPEYVTTLGNLAGTFRLKGEIDKAVEHFERCRSILQEKGLTAAFAYLYATTLNNLAMCHMETLQYDSALTEWSESVAVLQTIPDTEFDQAVAQVNLSILHQRQGLIEQSMHAIRSALSTLANHPEDPHYWAALNQQASLMVLDGKLTAAEAAYVNVRDKLLRTFGQNLDYAIACYNLSRTQEKLTERAKAIESATQAYAAYRSVLGDNHARTMQAQAWLMELET